MPVERQWEVSQWDIRMPYAGGGVTQEVIFSSIDNLFSTLHPFLKSLPSLPWEHRETVHRDLLNGATKQESLLTQPSLDATPKAMHLECICVHAKSQESFFFFPQEYEVGVQDLT